MLHIKIPETYKEYINILESKNWFREEIHINESNYLIETNAIKKGSTENMIILKCPGFYSTHQMILHKNSSFYLNVKDENGIELDKHSKIRITHIRPSEFVDQISRSFYDNLKKFEYGDIRKSFKSLRGEDRLWFTLVNSPVNIPKENIKFELTTDLWIKKVD